MKGCVTRRKNRGDYLSQQELCHPDHVGDEILMLVRDRFGALTADGSRVGRVRLPLVVVFGIDPLADEGPPIHLELGQGLSGQGHRQVQQLADRQVETEPSRTVVSGQAVRAGADHPRRIQGGHSLEVSAAILKVRLEM